MGTRDPLPAALGSPPHSPPCAFFRLLRLFRKFHLAEQSDVMVPLRRLQPEFDRAWAAAGVTGLERRQVDEVGRDAVPVQVNTVLK